MKEVFKSWMQALNEWVIRHENLKKFDVLSELGEGGQAKVYKIVKKEQFSEK